MNDLTIVLLGKSSDNFKDAPCKVISYDGSPIKRFLMHIHSKYVVFVRTDDILSGDYLDQILLKVNQGNFDCCYINYRVHDYPSIKIPTDGNALSYRLPMYGSYIWNYIFKTSKLNDLFSIPQDVSFDDYVKQIFQTYTSISKPILEHISTNRVLDKDFFYPDYRESIYLKNVIYVGNGCSGTFNGYVSWIRHIGKAFSSQYEIHVIFDGIGPRLKEEFESYFDCIQRDPMVNYYCERLLVTYSQYYYPRNIIYTDRSYLFIHGNLSDYPNSRHYYDDIYTDYYAVSKVAAEGAKGYYQTDNIQVLMNPFVLDPKLVIPHLKLCSAHRMSPIKKTERIEYMASIMDELGIPYTWNLFTDMKENTNHKGLIYRSRVVNPMPYIADSDYFVLLSDSEALPYSILEALSVHTKVVVTPLPSFFELGVKDGENAVVIPFEYFDEKNKDKLVEIIWKMYHDIGYSDFEYQYSPEHYSGYHDIFLS